MLAVWDVNEHQARADQIECSVGQWIEADIMTTHLEIAAAFFSQEPRIEANQRAICTWALIEF